MEDNNDEGEKKTVFLSEDFYCEKETKDVPLIYSDMNESQD